MPEDEVAEAKDASQGKEVKATEAGGDGGQEVKIAAQVRTTIVIQCADQLMLSVVFSIRSAFIPFCGCEGLCSCVCMVLILIKCLG